MPTAMQVRTGLRVSGQDKRPLWRNVPPSSGAIKIGHRPARPNTTLKTRAGNICSAGIIPEIGQKRNSPGHPWRPGVLFRPHAGLGSHAEGRVGGEYHFVSATSFFVASKIVRLSGPSRPRTGQRWFPVPGNVVISIDQEAGISV